MTVSIPDVLFSGKVRDTYPGDDPNTLVVVTSDRISVYDVVLKQAIPGKGKVLTHMTEFWLARNIISERPNHLLAGPNYRAQDLPKWAPEGRSLLVRKLNMLPIEAIVRGYITGSGWKEYKRTGKCSGIWLPPGMQEMEKFPEPLFTPSTKADAGEHDENIDFGRMIEILGSEKLAEAVHDQSILIYNLAADYARRKGIILVDTKLEFGLDPETGKLVLADEVLTPDSSRYVSVEDYEVGKPPVSMDKQFVRDWAAETDWDKKSDSPDMPEEVIAGTVEKYGEAAERLTGTNPLAV